MKSNYEIVNGRAWAVTLSRYFKLLLIVSLILLAITLPFKDKMPAPKTYRAYLPIDSPYQEKIDKEDFDVRSNNQVYEVNPLYAYEITGVIVSETKAGEFGDIWHYKRWKDFINVRDLCVIWGKNVSEGHYKQLKFSSDTWTCWAQSTGPNGFDFTKLSNNHLLTDNNRIKEKLMTAEVGDLVTMRGYLSEYRNYANGFFRGTSTIRTDAGNGACETIFLTDFKLVKKANPTLRALYDFGFYGLILSLVSLFILAFLTPLKSIN